MQRGKKTELQQQLKHPQFLTRFVCNCAMEKPRVFVIKTGIKLLPADATVASILSQIVVNVSLATEWPVTTQYSRNTTATEV